MKEKRGVVYTCITGGYDYLNNHTFINQEWDYVCFTDNLSIRSNDNSSWKIKPLFFNKLDNPRNQRWHKTHPHILFPDYKRSIWVDGNIDILKKDFFDDVEREIKDGHLFSIAIHNLRNCIYEELEACINLGKDDEAIMKKQIDLIKKEGFPPNQGLFETGLIYREHKNKKIKKIMEDWWWWIKNYSKRDQLSLTFVLWKNKFKAYPLSQESYRNKRDVIRIWPHLSEMRKLIIKFENLLEQNNPNQLKQIIQQQNQELELMKSSKFWKMREKYLKLKNKIIPRNKK